MFCGEADLLEIRLNVLNPYVDTFVLVEANETFSGLPKPLYYEEHKERFAAFSEKIVHHVVEPYSEEEWIEAKNSPNTGGLDHWCREYIQRENIKKGLIKAGVQDEDTVFMGDVDEIPDPEIAHIVPAWPIRLKLEVYSYYLNNKSSEEFWGTVMAQWKDIKDVSLNAARSSFQRSDGYGGWHFTSMGGVDELKRKIESYGHQEFNTPQVKDNLGRVLEEGGDYIGRNFTFRIDESAWPEYLKNNRENYEHLCKTTN